MPERLRPLIEAINRLKAELDALQPMPREAEDRLWKKLRMEWNYNSNHIEGNTLTYSEAEALIFFDRTSGDHTLQEYEEMRAHDVAIAMVKQWAAAHDRQLTQADIRALNEVILVRPFWKEAQTYDGQSTRRLIKVGEYKSQPNSVKTKTGEMFHYATPEETPRLMTELMDWYLGESADLPPISIAAEMHYRFIRIHPFDDGNGRVARLIVNYILMRHGFPPIVIESATKDKYLAALQKADAGDVLAFHAFLAERQIASLELALKAARGERLDEPGDALKRLELLKRQLKQVDEEQTIQVGFSSRLMVERFKQNIILLHKTIKKPIEEIGALFLHHYIKVDLGEEEGYVNEENDDLSSMLFMIEVEESYVSSDIKCSLRYNFGSFKHAGTKTFDAFFEILFQFSFSSYSVDVLIFDRVKRNHVLKSIATKLLHQELNTQEIEAISEMVQNSLMDEIEYRIKEKGILP